MPFRVRTFYGETGDGGPNPPDTIHYYRFVIYALDAGLDVGRSAGKAAFEDDATGHLLKDILLEGTSTS